MIADGCGNFLGLGPQTRRTAQGLVSAAIVLQIRKFQSASRTQQRVIGAALRLIGLFAQILGLLLQAAHYVNARPRTPEYSKNDALHSQIRAGPEEVQCLVSMLKR